MKDLEKMLMQKMGGKKEDSEMSPEMCQAKEDVLQELIEAMQGLQEQRVGDGMKSMQEVSVMAPDKEGMKKGLEKAEDVLEMLPSDEEEMESSEGEMEDKEEDDEDGGLFSKKRMKM